MENALLVRGGEPAAELARDVEGLVARQPADAPHQRGEVLAVDELHREEQVIVGLRHVVHAADRGVRDLARQPHLAVEPLETVRVGADPAGQELQRHGLVEAQVVGAVDLAHAAAADQADDAVAAGQHHSRDEPLAARGAPRRRVGGRAVGERGGARRGGLRTPRRRARRAVRDVRAAGGAPVLRRLDGRCARRADGHSLSGILHSTRTVAEKCRAGAAGRLSRSASCSARPARTGPRPASGGWPGGTRTRRSRSRAGRRARCRRRATSPPPASAG